jgi:hypothetical protein
MTDKIVNLFTGQSTGAPVPEVVAVLEDLLAQAKTGELQSFAFASQCADGAMVTGFTDSTDVFAMLGALRLVEYKLLGGIES